MRMSQYGNPKITVIIPAYNVEKYVKKCIKSVLEQTYKDFEIIVINDGSTDKTLEILNKFVLEDSRIRIIDQTNQKQGAARNRGLDIARGEYIIFIDADDWIDENYLEEMYSKITETNSDCAISNMMRCRNDRDYRVCFGFENSNVYTKIDDIIKILNLPTQFTASGKMYSRKIINNLYFEEGVYFEDGRFLIRVLSRLKSLVTVPEVIYHYVANNNSTLRKKYSPERARDRITGLLDIINFAEENNIPLGEVLIAKEKTHFGLSIKHYKTRRIYYLFGIKLFEKRVTFNMKEITNV